MKISKKTLTSNETRSSETLLVPLDFIVGTNNLNMTEYRILFLILLNQQRNSATVVDDKPIFLSKDEIANMYAIHKIPLSTSLSVEERSFIDKTFSFYASVEADTSISSLKPIKHGSWVYQVNSYPDGVEVVLSPPIRDLIVNAAKSTNQCIEVDFNQLKKMESSNNWRIYLALELIILSDLRNSGLQAGCVTVPVSYLSILSHNIEQDAVRFQTVFNVYMSSSEELFRTKLGMSLSLDLNEADESMVDVTIEFNDLPIAPITIIPRGFIESYNEFHVYELQLIIFTLNVLQQNSSALAYGQPIQLNFNEFRTFFFLAALTVSTQARTIQQNLGSPQNFFTPYESKDKAPIQLITDIEIIGRGRDRLIQVTFSDEVIALINSTLTEPPGLVVNTKIVAKLRNKWGIKFVLVMANYLFTTSGALKQPAPIELSETHFKELMGMNVEMYQKIPNLRRLCLDRIIVDLRDNGEVCFDNSKPLQYKQHAINNKIYILFSH